MTVYVTMSIIQERAQVVQRVKVALCICMLLISMEAMELLELRLVSGAVS